MEKVKQDKRRYAKPKVDKVALKAEEVLAAGCKTTSIAGATTTPCTAGCGVEGS